MHSSAAGLSTEDVSRSSRKDSSPLLQRPNRKWQLSHRTPRRASCARPSTAPTRSRLRDAGPFVAEMYIIKDISRETVSLGESRAPLAKIAARSNLSQKFESLSRVTARRRVSVGSRNDDARFRISNLESRREREGSRAARLCAVPEQNLRSAGTKPPNGPIFSRRVEAWSDPKRTLHCVLVYPSFPPRNTERVQRVVVVGMSAQCSRMRTRA